MKTLQELQQIITDYRYAHVNAAIPKWRSSHKTIEQFYWLYQQADFERRMKMPQVAEPTPSLRLPDTLMGFDIVYDETIPYGEFVLE